MKNNIINKLKEIEERESIKIIYALESGSRAWGIASKDSDYDVRFVYVRKLKDYIRLGKRKDTLECELNEVYDIAGWDLSKIFTLAYNGNQTPFEWSGSPVNYKITPEWESARKVILSYFNGRAAIYHYFNMAKKSYCSIADCEKVRLKKYFYILRAIFCCMYILKTGNVPFVEFDKNIAELFEQDIVNTKVYNKIYELKELKSLADEKTETDRVKCIDNFIENCLSEISAKAETVSVGEKKNISSAEKVLFDIIMKYDL